MAKVFNDIEITKEDGSKVKMKILFTFEDATHNRDYVLYYNPDDVQDESVYAYRFDDLGNLYEIESDEEWDLIKDVYEDYMENLDEE